MLTVSYSSAVSGIDGFIVTVECDSVMDFAHLDIVGLPDASVKESEQRVRAAAGNSGFEFPQLALTVNLAPADVKKEGCALDMAIFAAIMQSGGVIPKQADLHECCFIGELLFSGGVRSVRGVLPMALAARDAGIKRLFVPAGNAGEAAVVEGLTVYPVENVAQLVAHLRGEEQIAPAPEFRFGEDGGESFDCDFSEVRGQERAKRALEIAAAGAHNILLIGPPGAGKSMLAKRLPTILPPMTFDEALVTTKIHSVAGLLGSGSLVRRRPFRSPHHTLSAPAMVGGGKNPMPGEISIAHGGVLFLDELPEFPKNVTESLRQPLEDGCVTVTRTAGRFTFPSSFMLVCAMNPCKCGYYGSDKRQCTCKKEDIKKYLSKISGPLLDRIDIQIELPSVEFGQLTAEAASEPSEKIRARVTAARELAYRRQGKHNAALGSSEIRQRCPVDERGKAVLQKAFDSLAMSARGYDRVLRVARTIADLRGGADISPADMAEAVQLRTLDRSYW